MQRVYLDNNATTPILPEVFEAMRPWFGEHFGNASSIHHHGQETRAAENGRHHVKEIETGQFASEVEVGFEKGADGPNVLPVSLEDEGEHALILNGSRDDVFAEIGE